MSGQINPINSNPAKPKILLVDDDADLLRLLTIRLTAADYDVISAESGEQALALLTVTRPQLVITDLRMGGMDGMALFEAIHTINPSLPVIIATAHGSIPEAVAATKQGVYGFLAKPFDSKALLTQINSALQLTGNVDSTNSYSDGGAVDQNWRKDIITRSPIMEDLLSQAKLLAAGDASIFIRGESGTGKELLARAIHASSPRGAKPFIGINCSAIPEALLESELFGHSKGSFTGATQDYVGLFQSAEGGTVLLDEIGDMPLALQTKLLRVLQERQVRPVGSVKTIPIDVRIISATHRDLEKEMALGNFREDLYYRLNVVSLSLPSLVERREDIPLLASHFLAQISERYRKNIKRFAPEAMELLSLAPWPGNVRQLLNLIEQVVALCSTSIIPASLVQRALQNRPAEFPSLAEAKNKFEREYLAQILKITNGNVGHAARLAQRNRTEFYRLLQRHQLSPSLFRAE